MDSGVSNPAGPVSDVRFDAVSDTYRADYDPETTTASMAVIALVARILETSPIEIAQLQYSVDTEALDALLGATETAGDVEICFRFEAFDITVYETEIVVKSTPHSEEKTADT